MAIKSALGRQFGTQFDSVFDVAKSNPIYDKAGGRIPSLDLNFARSESLRDSRSTENKITFTRASRGTFVGADGLIKTTPVNLMTYSEDLTQWNQFFSATVTPNVATAPDGTFTADLIDVTAGGNAQVVKSFTGAPSTTYTVSFFAKSTTATDVIRLYRTNPNGGSVDINITNEWQRYTSTYTTDASSPYTQVLFIFKPGSTNQYYVWGVQVEEGSTATEYIPTTSTISGAPRFDHDLATGESLGLLIEESRTNTVLNSDTAPATVLMGTVSLPLESVVSPRGITENVRKVELLSGSSALRFGPGAGQGAINTTYSVSFWIKSVDGGTGSVNIDINDRNITEVPYTGEWTRITRTGGNRSDASHQFFDLTQRASTTDFYLFGAQMETGSFATSYIPTEGSTVTRAADVVEITGTNLSSFYNQSEGTVFAEASSYPHPVTGKALVPLAYSDNSFNNRVTLASSTSNNQFNFDVTSGGSQQRGILGNFVSTGLKAAGGYKATGSAGSLDGATAVTSSTSSIPSSINRLDIGNAHNGGQSLNGHIKRLIYFNTRLSDDKLESITA